MARFTTVLSGFSQPAPPGPSALKRDPPATGPGRGTAGLSKNRGSIQPRSSRAEQPRHTWSVCASAAGAERMIVHWGDELIVHVEAARASVQSSPSSCLAWTGRSCHACVTTTMVLVAESLKWSSAWWYFQRLIFGRSLSCVSYAMIVWPQSSTFYRV